MVELKHGVFGGVRSPKEETQEPTKMATPDLKSLVELGCVRDEIAIGDMRFAMRSLSAAESVEINRRATEATQDPQKLFELNIFVLALSIDTVNGVPLEDFGEPSDNILAARQRVISQLQGPVLSKLLDCYVELTKRAGSQFSAEQVKN